MAGGRHEEKVGKADKRARRRRERRLKEYEQERRKVKTSE